MLITIGYCGYLKYFTYYCFTLQKKKKPRSGGRKKPSVIEKKAVPQESTSEPKIAINRFITKTPPNLVKDVSQKVRAVNKTEIKRPKSGGFKRTSRITRPSTQERSIELRKTSVSRTSVIMDEFPHSKPPRTIYFSGKRPLDDIKPRPERGRLGRVDEHVSPRPTPRVNSTSKTNYQTNYAAYRESLVKHAKREPEAPRSEKPQENSVPRRNVPPVPFVMGTTRSRPRRDVDPLYSSHNFDKLISREFDNRPKTSPEILERRPSSTASAGGTERIQLRNPDSQLIDLMSILNNSNSNSNRPNRFMTTPPQTMSSLFDSNFQNSNNIHRNMKTPLSTSLVSSKGKRGTQSKPTSASSTTFGNLTFGSNSSRDHTELLRELIKSQVVNTKPSSRKSTPEQAKKVRRPVSGRGHVPASPARLPPVTPHRHVGQRPRCAQCNRRIQISNTYDCRCGHAFCGQHRYAESHACTFDYKAEGRKLLQIANPLVQPQKLPKI